VAKGGTTKLLFREKLQRKVKRKRKKEGLFRFNIRKRNVQQFLSWRSKKEEHQT